MDEYYDDKFLFLDQLAGKSCKELATVKTEFSVRERDTGRSRRKAAKYVVLIT
jgi:hypothetical protein